MTHHLTSAAFVAALAGSALAQDPCMMRGINWRTETILTIGEPVNGFTMTGIPDGMSAWPMANGNVKVLIQSELNPGTGYAYSLANGTMLTGARISYLEVSRTNGKVTVHDAGLAYDKIYDRQGNLVVDASQVNETGNSIDGFARFCSGTGIEGGTYSFVDDMHIANEETGVPSHPHGGTCWALDIDTQSMWAIPSFGRAAWENVAAIDSGDPQTVALLLGDDTAGAPLYLYVGTKNAIGDQSFLDRNGLAVGTVYYWVADNGDTSPQQFNGNGTSRTGTFRPIAVRDAAMAGMPGYDADGYLDNDTLRNAATGAGAFQFSRPEDLHTNPSNSNQVAFASTGRGQQFPADNWGTTYVIDVNAVARTATLTIIADSDGLPTPDAGVRNPDNLVWASDGYVYVQEDRSTSPSSLFGAASGRDASIWKVDPTNGAIERVGEMNRTVVLPAGTTDRGAGTLGVWESSGIIDVTHLFPTQPGEVLLLANVQAHGIQDGIIGGNANLDEGGQIFFMTNQGIDHAILSAQGNPTGTDLRFEVTGGTPGNGYAVVFALTNAGNAPNGWFYGIDITIPEFGFIVPPLLGMLDNQGGASFTINVPGGYPIGIIGDVVTIELDSMGLPRNSSNATTHRL